MSSLLRKREHFCPATHCTLCTIMHCYRAAWRACARDSWISLASDATDSNICGSSRTKTMKQYIMYWYPASRKKQKCIKHDAPTRTWRSTGHLQHQLRRLHAKLQAAREDAPQDSNLRTPGGGPPYLICSSMKRSQSSLPSRPLKK